MTTVATRRVRPRRPASTATGTSTIDSIAPVAATAVSTKNANMNTAPAGMLANTAGTVMNTSDGPASGLNPKANTAGKIAMPASIDTVRSASITRAAVTGMFCSERK